MSEPIQIRFPCSAVPEEAPAARLLGIYPQAPMLQSGGGGAQQEGLFMQRVKAPAGRLAAAQLRRLAELARELTPDFPLHFTTRQDIELHGLKRDHVPAAQRGLAAAGLSTVGACGDTLRNITVCPGGGHCRGSLDLLPLAQAIGDAAESLPWIRSLPRKFKMSFSGCSAACAKPYINDLGFVAQSDGGFSAIIAGSLGPRPAAGIAFGLRLAREELIPFSTAAVRLFHAEGDRSNRARARLRHVRERLGDEVFLKRLGTLFDEERRQAVAPSMAMPQAAGPKLVARLRLPLGDLEPAAALKLAQLLEGGRCGLRIGLEHDLLLFGESPLETTPVLEPLRRGPRLLCCPGTTWCSRGLVDCRAAASAALAQLPGDESILVAFSGCPNNCSQAAVADVGFIGRIRTLAGRRSECYRLLAGGGRGQSDALALELHPLVPADQAPSLAAWLVSEYRRSRRAQSESLGDFVRRTAAALSAAIQDRLGA